MLFYAVLLIKEVFSMFKVPSGPTDRRPIVARKDSQQAEEIEIVDETTTQAEPTNHRASKRAEMEQQDTTLPVRQLDAAAQIRSPNHLPKRFKITVPSPAGSLNHFLKPLSVSKAAPQDAQKEITEYERFHSSWRHMCVLGEGGEGVVHLYERRKQPGKSVAVKLPRSHYARENLLQEFKNMWILDPHEHILELLCATKKWHPCGPALFLPICDLGDLVTYRETWCTQQAWEGKPERISEITMWKLFRDMVLALNYLHHELGIRYVHNDFKPGNILAVTPPDCIGYETLPEEPIFKLSDFARLTPWPTPKGEHPTGFNGTPEYAPPEVERLAPVHTSVDIWGLGATLQLMAFGMHPTQSREAYLRTRKAQGKPCPELGDTEEWNTEYWRMRVPVVFRPLNVSVKMLQKKYDLPHWIPDHQPYGSRLNYWYAKLWNPVATRPKASHLMQVAIPHMDDQIERLKLKRKKQMCQA